MKRAKTSPLGSGGLQLKRRKVESVFFNQANAVTGWHPLRVLIEPCLRPIRSPPTTRAGCWGERIFPVYNVMPDLKMAMSR